jgi:hypothetical protein
MVINYLNLKCIAILKAKAYSPSVIDENKIGDNPLVLHLSTAITMTLGVAELTSRTVPISMGVVEKNDGSFPSGKKFALHWVQAQDFTHGTESPPVDRKRPEGL